MSEGPIRVLVADDDEDHRGLLEVIVSRADDMELVGAAHDATSAVKLAAELKPDVVVLDWMMPGGGGSTAAKQILVDREETRILAWTASELTGASYDMMGAGATGMVAKGSSSEEILGAIRSVIRW